jgi:uncharacterized protein DUF2283
VKIRIYDEGAIIYVEVKNGNVNRTQTPDPHVRLDYEDRELVGVEVIEDTGAEKLYRPFIPQEIQVENVAAEIKDLKSPVDVEVLTGTEIIFRKKRLESV